MRLTPEEILELTEQLVSVLKRKRFSVKTNRYGNILYVEKFGIRCCPAILNSLEDGRHGYAYIQLITNSYSEKDLGSYYKPRTNKSTHKIFDKNDSVDKYAGKDVHIDMHNGKQVIETFVNDLNKDYRRITMKREDLEIDSGEDTGICKWSPLNYGWVVDSVEAKVNICKILREHLPEMKRNLSTIAACEILESKIDMLENPKWFDGSWLVKHTPENLTINNLDLVVASCVSFPGSVGKDVDDYIESWVRDNQKKIWGESLVESLVKIKDTGTVFDGMTGTVEKDDGNKLTVMVDFNDEHKVRNTFKKEQIEILED